MGRGGKATGEPTGRGDGGNAGAKGDGDTIGGENGIGPIIGGADIGGNELGPI